MNLLIDSGNSFIKWALADENSLAIENRCPTSKVSSLCKHWAGSVAPARVIVSNVAGESTAIEIKKTVNVLWHIDTEFVASSRNCCGLTNSYHSPGQLGVDRWMAMAAAFQLTSDPVIVVDCGTAVTIDLVNQQGLFVGGVIMPGLNTSLQSLRAGTEAVEEINSFRKDVSPVAQSTEDGVAIGVLLGLAGGIERVVREQAQLLGDAPIVFLTGGDAEALLPHLTMPTVLQPDLVLQGLQIVASHN